MKTCIKCNTPKHLDEFVKDKRRADGRGSWCVLCNRAYMNQIADMWSWGRDKVIAEIVKCDLVCCICHRIRTQSRKAQQEEAA